MAKKGEKLTPKEELFCRYYALGADTFGNATLSYVYAYGMQDKIPRKDYSGKFETGSKEYRVCKTEGNRILTKPDIDAHITNLLNEFNHDKVADGELIYVLKQRKDLASKITAVREYNRLKKRGAKEEDGPTKIEIQIKGFTNGKNDN